MSRLVLVGAGGAGREVLALVLGSPEFLADTGIDSVVFVDDRVKEAPIPVVSSLRDYVPAVDDLLLCTINDPAARRAATIALTDRGARFIRYVHPSTVVGDRVTLGEGAIVYPRCVLTADIGTGKHLFLNTAAVIGHDACVGDFVTVGPGTQLLGGVHVDDEAWFGASATVLPDARIGRAARVGAGSVVLRRVRDKSTVFGNPARVIS